MKRLKTNIWILLVCYSALWVSSADRDVHNNSLEFSMEDEFPLTKTAGDINQRSLSPWKWRHTVVKNQWPEVIWEAECSTAFCFDPKSSETLDNNLNSVPVYQDILVLTLSNGTHFKASYQSVAVGCTCVWASVTQDG